MSSIEAAFPNSGSNGEISIPVDVRRHDVHKVSTLGEIQACLAELAAREKTVASRLDTLLSTQASFARDLHRLDLLRVQLSSQLLTARSLSHSILAPAASTATRISSAVARLDTEQSNVRSTLAVVDQVLELKACVLGVNGSMGAAQDWETAASYLSRARRIPVEVLEGAFAARVVPTAEIPDPPATTLEHAAESLCALFTREFDKAAKEGDGENVTRFFKLFPLIGRTEVGLDCYGRYVCHGVAARARANFSASASGRQAQGGFFYANALTKLFEHIAQIVDAHEPLVARHYGQGMMNRVISRLQMEVDTQGGIILDTWSEEREVERRLTDIKSYAYSFLVQSFLSAPKTALGAHTPRSSSPAVRDGVSSGNDNQEEGIDMKDVDSMLGESALMLGRWALYSRFLATKCAAPQESDEDEEPSKNVQLTMPDIVSESTLHKKIRNILIEAFNTLSSFFFRRSVEKAFQLDEPPAELSLNIGRTLGSTPPFITSAVDDVMYIVNQVLQRSLSTAQRGVVTNVVPTVSRVLNSDFVGMIQRKMRDECYPKAIIQGGLPPEDKIISFIVLMNNLDIATDYLKRILEPYLHDGDSSIVNGTPAASGTNYVSIPDMFPFGNDATTVENALKTVGSSFESKTAELLTDGTNVLFHQVIKPRIRPMLAEAFRDIDYSLSDEELADLLRREADESSTATSADPLADDTVKRRFLRVWGALTRPLKRISTDHNADRIHGAAVRHLAKTLEKRVWGYYGRVNELGAARLERDVATIVAVAVEGGKYALRDEFTRIIQITMIMTMENDEWDEIMRATTASAEEGSHDQQEWILSAEERRQARSMIAARAKGGPAAISTASGDGDV